jgi:prepilin-type N-terminal cleavage/methylation domain-containing protein
MQSPQTHARPRHTARGFTLVELLVVVAIVSMLLAILMPSLSRARAQSRVSVCLSNLREIGLGVQAYAAQYNDAIPRGPADPMFYFPTQGWDEWATNQVWLGTLKANQGLGTLLDVDLRRGRVLLVPLPATRPDHARSAGLPGHERSWSRSPGARARRQQPRRRRLRAHQPRSSRGEHPLSRRTRRDAR